MRNTLLVIILLCVLLFFHAIALSSWHGLWTLYLNPLILFLSAIIPGFLLISYSAKTSADFISVSLRFKIVVAVICIFCIAICYFFFTPILITSSSVLHVERYSDVIPQLHTLNERLLAGEFPYQQIDFYGYALYPTYLPLQWLPYSIAEIMHFDYRLISFFALMIALSVFAFQIIKSQSPHAFKIFWILIPFTAYILLLLFNEYDFQFSVESLIAAYYILLVLALMKRNIVFISAAIILCLLSRYSLVLWLPLLALVFYFENKKQLGKGLIIVISGVLIFYVIPFLLQDVSVFTNGFAYHTKAARAVWEAMDNAPGDKPEKLFSGYGFAGYFYDTLHGTVESKFNTLRLTHFLFSMGSVILLGIFYLKKKATLQSVGFLIGSLQVYLVIFYTFIQIPYSYLFIVPFFTGMLTTFYLIYILISNREKITALI
ncbi:MAG: hypothetical protein IPN31_05735 [Bacteroidetes bacterium]|nr:hypothetical protein [Bacteroidota bacterium]